MDARRGREGGREARPTRWIDQSENGRGEEHTDAELRESPVKEDVRTFEVAVDDSFVMQVDEAAA